MRTERTEYVVQGWGVGTLWTGNGNVVAHELALDVHVAQPTSAAHGAAGAEQGAVPKRARPGTVPRAREGFDSPSAPPGAPPAALGAVPGTVPKAAMREARAAPHEGAARPPNVTLATTVSHVGNGIVPDGSRAAPPAPELGPADVVARLAAFFRGEDALGDVPVDLAWCTPFQRSVAEALRAIPHGEVVSYGELAALAGHPNAQRAVGTFCARNRLMLFVPCHRVVAAEGIGRYGSAGVAVKRRLLGLEGVAL